MSIAIDLSGKVAIITGGSQGIGRSTAERLVQAGAQVSLCARRPHLLEEVKTQLGVDRVLTTPADVAVAEDIDRVVRATLERFGRIDILVNNAGTSMRGAFESVSDEQWRHDFDLKLFAAVRFCRQVIPSMRAQGGGRIINVTNFISKQPFARSAPTSVSRAAGLALTKALSKEFAVDNILVNTVCMGFVHAAQHETKAQQMGLGLPEYYAKLAGEIPLGRVGETREAADVILFLASSLASYVTGTSINVDGGICAVL